MRIGTIVAVEQFFIGYFYVFCIVVYSIVILNIIACLKADVHNRYFGNMKNLKFRTALLPYIDFGLLKTVWKFKKFSPAHIIM